VIQVYIPHAIHMPFSFQRKENGKKKRKRKNIEKL